MAWTATTFKAAYAEFAPTDDAVVARALADAARGCDARIFGDRLDEAVALRAAHNLSSAPSGQQARLAANLGDTTYWQRWLQLARECAGGPWTVGQRP